MSFGSALFIIFFIGLKKKEKLPTRGRGGHFFIVEGLTEGALCDLQSRFFGIPTLTEIFFMGLKKGGTLQTTRKLNN